MTSPPMTVMSCSSKLASFPSSTSQLLSTQMLRSGTWERGCCQASIQALPIPSHPITLQAPSLLCVYIYFILHTISSKYVLETHPLVYGAKLSSVCVCCAGDRPLVVQFAASNWKDFADAAELVAPFADGVDLNCGCPQRYVHVHVL